MLPRDPATHRRRPRQPPRGRRPASASWPPARPAGPTPRPCPGDVTHALGLGRRRRPGRPGRAHRSAGPARHRRRRRPAPHHKSRLRPRRHRGLRRRRRPRPAPAARASTPPRTRRARQGRRRDPPAPAGHQTHTVGARRPCAGDRDRAHRPRRPAGTDPATAGHAQQLLDDVHACLRTGVRLADRGWPRQLVGLVAHTTSDPHNTLRSGGVL